MRMGEGANRGLDMAWEGFECCPGRIPSQAVHAAVSELRAVQGEVDSDLLIHLTSSSSSSNDNTDDTNAQARGGGGSWERVSASLRALSEAANWSEAEKTGRVVPSEVSPFITYSS